MPTVRIRCDRCGTVRQAASGVGPEKLRLALNKVGWSCSNDRNSDLCASCRSAQAAKAGR